MKLSINLPGFRLGGKSTSFNRRRAVLDTVTKDVTDVRMVMER
ncbi:MAG TPA: hypothetical protein VEZ11_13390 [Thermoanaerobaculia bacterium]|nr:hypothetical protein [Thermoanaerobaculia bacterium]